jgi:hypothetical protein
MNHEMTRRGLFQTATAAFGGSLLAPGLMAAAAECSNEKTDSERAEKAVKALYDSLTDSQRKIMCLDWDAKGYGNLPLRLHVTNNWAVSPMTVGALRKEQQALVEDIFVSVLQPDWPAKLHQQAKDDTGKDWTEDRKIAIFGTPGSGQCQCVISGFHLTFRAGKAKDSPVAFGGAICHGHQPSGFNEKPGHPGNIFWYQAQEAHRSTSFSTATSESRPW